MTPWVVCFLGQPQSIRAAFGTVYSWAPSRSRCPTGRPGCPLRGRFDHLSRITRRRHRRRSSAAAAGFSFRAKKTLIFHAHRAASRLCALTPKHRPPSTVDDKKPQRSRQRKRTASKRAHKEMEWRAGHAALPRFHPRFHPHILPVPPAQCADSAAILPRRRPWRPPATKNGCQRAFLNEKPHSSVPFRNLIVKMALIRL